MTSEPVVIVEGVRFAYGDRRVVSDVDLSVAAGECVAVLGPSGSGKSSLLRLIAGLERPGQGRIGLSGRVVADDRRMVPPEERGVGLVFQDDALFPHLTILDNVAFGLRTGPRRDRKAAALQVLARFGLADRAKDWPHRLSGGEQQRVAVARALAPRPPLMLMDEPFSRLDTDLRHRVREDVMPVLREAGVAVVLVTHDAEEAMSCADRLVLMAEGRVLQTGSPEACYRAPSSVQAGRLLGPLNVAPAIVMSGRASSPFGVVPANDVADGAVEMLFRPEDLIPDETGAEARRVSTTFLGATARLRLEVDGRPVEMMCAAEAVPEGDVVRIGFASNARPTLIPNP